MGTFTPNIGLILPTPGDPAVTNAWGTLLNTNFSLLDSQINGILPLDCSGGGTIILTSTPGSADQARSAIFVLTGALPNNTTILWPEGITGDFIVNNQTTGAFAVTFGADNGSGSPGGATASVTQGGIGNFYTDGTNIYATTSTTEPGTFTPVDASPAGLVLINPVGYSRQIPGAMMVWGSFGVQANSDPNALTIGGLPLAAANLLTHAGFQGLVQFGGGAGTPGGAAPNWLNVLPNTTHMFFRWGGSVPITNAMASGYTVDFQVTYPT